MVHIAYYQCSTRQRRMQKSDISAVVSAKLSTVEQKTLIKVIYCISLPLISYQRMITASQVREQQQQNSICPD